MSVWRTRRAFVAACLVAVGCGGDDTSPARPPDPPKACAEGEHKREDGTCVRAGLPLDLPCPPGEWARDEGTCAAAGVPEDGCAEGFVHDGDHGCDPVLPAEPCAEGLVAIPGETDCHELVPCGSGTWGDIPVRSGTHYVDATYAGADSDGSEAKPWTTIQEALDAAPFGGLVAVAAGSYAEDLILDRQVHLWGRCPSLVEVVATGGALSAVFVKPGASGSEVHALAVRGNAEGVLVSGVKNVVVENVWLHDLGDRGFSAESALGPTSVTLRGSLVEHSQSAGVFASATDLVIEGTAVRDTELVSGNGRGVNIQASTGASVPSSFEIRGSIIERSVGIGLHIGRSEGVVEGSVIRDTIADSTYSARAINVDKTLTLDPPLAVTVRGSLISGSREAAVVFGESDGTVDSTVVRDTVPGAVSRGGRAISAYASKVLLKNSLIEDSQEVAVVVDGTQGIVEGTLVRRTLPDVDPSRGVGLVAQIGGDTGVRSTLTMRASVIESSTNFGILVIASDATIETSVARTTAPNNVGHAGRGINVQHLIDTSEPSNVTLTSSIVEQNTESGVAVVSSNVVVDHCVVQDTLATSDLQAGDGITVWSAQGPATATITATLVERSARAAVANWAGTVDLGDSAFLCSSFDLDGESDASGPFAFDDLGGNLCGCPTATTTCTAVSSGFAPPTPVMGPQ